jgi:hypothetical protein
MAEDFSLVRGGPLYRLLRWTRVVGPGPLSPQRLAIAFACVTWLPLMLLAALSWALGRMDVLALDLGVHARLLVGAPLVFIAETELDRRTGRAMSRFVAGGYAGPGTEELVRRIEARALRRRDAWLPEVALAGASVGIGVATLAGALSPTGFVPGVAHPSAFLPARTWYALVALPLYQLVAWRLFWRWLIWCVMLLRLSRLELRLWPAHRDRAGGIAFLAGPCNAIGWLWMAHSIVASASWSELVAFEHANRADFALPTIVYVGFVYAATLGPLFLFSVKLQRGRERGSRAYGHLIDVHTRLFEARWLPEPAPAFLGAPEISTAYDLGGLFEYVKRMRLVPFGTTLVIALLAWTLAPMIPFYLSAVPAHELLKSLLHVLVPG